MITLEQVYAGRAYKRVVDFRDAPTTSDTEREKYLSMAKELPILIRTAGLAEALAFVNTREEVHRALLEDIAQVVNEADRETLLKMSREAKMQEYVYLTQRTLLALNWFKRFAQSVLDVEATQEGGTP